MNNIPSREIVENIRARYPEGTRVQLDYMNDRQAPTRGTCGTVISVDSIGTIHVAWDNGSSLGVAYGEDSCHKVTY